MSNASGRVSFDSNLSGPSERISVVKNTFLSFEVPQVETPARHTCADIRSLCASLASQSEYRLAECRNSSYNSFSTFCNASSDEPCLHSPSGSLCSDEVHTSHFHAVGGCRPCVFMFRYGKCTNGNACGFCHYEHDAAYIKAKKKENKKNARSRRAF